MSLKLYHFPHKIYRTERTHDRLVLADSKKSAIKELSGLTDITNYTVSKIQAIKYEFLRFEAIVGITNSSVFMSATIKTDVEPSRANKDRIAYIGMTIHISQNFKTQSELLELFNQQFKSSTLYHEE